MNKITFFTAAMAVCGAVVVGPTSAQEKTRAEVIGELAQSRSDGVMQALHGEDSGSFFLSQQPVEWTQTRQAVLDRVAEARATGELQALASECGCGMDPSGPLPRSWQAEAGQGADGQAGQAGIEPAAVYAGPDAAPSAELEDEAIARVA